MDFIKKNKKVISVVCLVALIICLLFATFKIIPTGYTGIKTTFGQTSDKNLSPGLVARIPFAQNVKLVCNKQQDKIIKAEIWGETSEKTPLSASDITITYQIIPEKSSWIYINVNNVKQLIDDSMTASAIKSAMVQLNTVEATNRSKIEPLAKSMLQQSVDEKYGKDTIKVLKVVINQMDFEASYNKAIADKSIAIQTYEKQSIENKKAVEKAEADKQVKIKNAEAEAKAKLIQAEAEAKANEKISKSLDEKILKSKFYDKWNGKLPDVMSDGTVITNIQ